MTTSATTTIQPADASPAPGRGWNRIRPIVFWAATFVIGFELAAGSVWNLFSIGWVEAQLNHLGYPSHFAYVLGFWQAAAAVAIIVPRLGLLKEWAYAGSFFLWSGAVVSHLVLGDGPTLWGVPLMFGVFAVVSWALRPADRRPGGGWWETRPRAWVVPVGLLVALFTVSLLTLPAAEATMYERAVDLGWIDN